MGHTEEKPTVGTDGEEFRFQCGKLQLPVAHSRRMLGDQLQHIHVCTRIYPSKAGLICTHTHFAILSKIMKCSLQLVSCFTCKACLELACPPTVGAATEGTGSLRETSTPHVCTLLCFYRFLLHADSTCTIWIFLVCCPPPWLKPQLFGASSAPGFQCAKERRNRKPWGRPLTCIHNCLRYEQSVQPWFNPGL